MTLQCLHRFTEDPAVAGEGMPESSSRRGKFHTQIHFANMSSARQTAQTERLSHLKIFFILNYLENPLPLILVADW